jgi:hypothetical protein
MITLGASRGLPSRCGGGMLLFPSHINFFYLKLDIVERTNTMTLFYVYKEFYYKVDLLSKEALSLDEGYFSVQHFVEGFLSQKNPFKFY